MSRTRKAHNKWYDDWDEEDPEIKKRRDKSRRELKRFKNQAKTRVDNVNDEDG